MNFFDILLAKKLSGSGGGGSADLETKTVEYTQNTAASGDVLTPSSGKDGFSQVTVKVNVPSSGANLQTKSIRITDDGNYTVTPDEGYDGMDEVEIIAAVNVGFKTGTFLLSTDSILPVNISAPTADYLLIMCEDDLIGTNGMQCLYAINEGDGEAHQAWGVRGNNNSQTSMSLINFSATTVQFGNSVITVTPGANGAAFVAGKTYRWYAW